MQKITTFLMFEGNAEAAMTFYVGLFPDGKVLDVQKYGAEGPGPEGSIMRASFRLAGGEYQVSDSFVPHPFTFTPSVSLFVNCDDAAEFDRVWAALSEGGEALMPVDNYGFSQRFGWCNDRFGVSWQINLP